MAITFVPGDPPRAGGFVFYNTARTEEELDARWGERSSVELVLPSARGKKIERREVACRRVSIRQALGLLGPCGGTNRAPNSLMDPRGGARHWASALLTGLGLVAKGRLYPAVTRRGWDGWRVGPLGSEERSYLLAWSESLPPGAHALASPNGSPLEVLSPETLLVALWDGLADTFVRTAGARVASGSDFFASVEPVASSHLEHWLSEAGGGLSATDGIDVALRIELDTGESIDEGARDGTGLPPIGQAVVQVASRLDPSLVVDASDLYGSNLAGPAALWGSDVEAELLRSLRRAARAWPPMEQLLHQRVPRGLDLGTDLLADLMTDGAGRLSDAGIGVLWPKGMLEHSVSIRAMVGASGVVKQSGLSLDGLVSFSWQATLDGDLLSASEIDQLAEAKRGLVRMRGRWVSIDAATLQRLRSLRERKLTMAEGIGLLLGQTIDLDGELVDVVANGALASVLERIRESSGGMLVDLPEPPGLATEVELRPYQKRGVAWLKAMSDLGLGGCLADDMGLGKTLQVIVLHLHRVQRDRGPALVVCPTSLLANWEREVKRFAPGLPVRRYHGPNRSLEAMKPGEIVLTSYGVTRREFEALRSVGFSMVIADEAQHTKNPRTASAKALRQVGGEIRFALTGTPVENRLSELWAILDWVAPGLLGSLDHFVRTVARPVERDHDEEVAARLSRVIGPFLLRRRKSDPSVAPDLPERVVTDVPVPLTREQASLYEAEVREALDRIKAAEPGLGRQALVLRLLTALKQICNHPAQYLHQKGPLQGRSGKLAAFEELVEVIVSEGESLLVFSQFVECLRVIEHRLVELGYAPLVLHGGIGASARMDIVDAFQARRSPILLCSLKAGGVGLNLTTATHVIHYDRWWNPAVEDQATDRAHRIGQRHSVQVHRLIAEGTLEDRIATIIEEKRELAESIVGGGESWIGELSDNELEELVELGVKE